MEMLRGRVAVITGAGRGLGREYSLLFAQEGAKVVVNDLGGSTGGEGEDSSPAAAVVAEIRDSGGEAVANHDDVADGEGAQRLVQDAIDSFGRLDVLVNNAGILRDRMLVNMTEGDWDSVIRVHLRGHFLPTRWAAAHWRERAKTGEQDVKASVINTSSGSGLRGNAGQANYGSAKAGIAAFTIIVAQELEQYGVRVNCIAPGARTRLTTNTTRLADSVAPPEDAAQFDDWDPTNVAPLVAYLATPDCPFNGRVFRVRGGVVQEYEPWRLGAKIEKQGRWTLEELDTHMKEFLTAQEIVSE